MNITLAIKESLLTADAQQTRDIRDQIANFITTCDDIEDVIPAAWIAWIDKKLVAPLRNSKFWKTVNAKECYLYTKFTRRFFPMVGSDEWAATSTESYKQSYPDFEDYTKHSNFEKGKNIKLHTNFGMIPQLDVSKITIEIQDVKKIISMVVTINDVNLKAKLWYLIATNYELCHLVLKDCVAFTLDLFKLCPDLVIGGLFWTQYILSHEESTATAPAITSRFVFTVPEILELKFLNNLPLDTTPWITNALRNTNIYNSMLFYLTGDRSICDIDKIRERINITTMNCFDGFEMFDNVALVGSTLTECVSNNDLLKSTASHDRTDGYILTRNPADKPGKTDDLESFKNRSALYYPVEGEFASDMDIAIVELSYKKFVEKAYEVIELLDKNMGTKFVVVEDCTASGVRFHLTHAVLKRKIEIFRTPQTLMKLVTGFHVPCVRMFWNFKQLYMTRSCAASLITGVNENFNWFSSNKVPADVVLKYAQRGFTTVLNHKELDCLRKYLHTTARWGYGFTQQTEIMGCFSRDHPFFRVDAIPRGIRFELPARPVYVGTLTSTAAIPTQLVYKEMIFSRYEERDNTYRVSQPPILFMV